MHYDLCVHELVMVIPRLQVVLETVLIYLHTKVTWIGYLEIQLVAGKGIEEWELEKVMHGERIQNKNRRRNRERIHLIKGFVESNHMYVR